MFKLSSKNPNHKMIHWKLLHRVYLTPMKCFYMNLSSSPKCNLCSQGSLGTFLHFFWECPSLSPFWTQLSKDLSYLLGTEICLTPRHFFMNDFWDFTLSIQQRCLPGPCRDLWRGRCSKYKRVTWNTAFNRAVFFADMCIEMDASVLIQQQMP